MVIQTINGGKDRVSRDEGVTAPTTGSVEPSEAQNQNYDAPSGAPSSGLMRAIILDLPSKTPVQRGLVNPTPQAPKLGAKRRPYTHKWRPTEAME